MKYDIYVYSFLISSVLGYCMTYSFRFLAIVFHILDVPHGSLKVHKNPTPYLGGVAVFMTIVSMLFFVFYVTGMSRHVFNPFFIGITGALMVGLYDDLYAITPRQKFFGQMCAIAGMLHYIEHPYLQTWLGYGLYFFFILSIMNACNLIDIMDGLLTVAMISSMISFGMVALLQGLHEITMFCAIVLGAILGFLMWNKPLARIYLGDAGALLYGIILGYIPLHIHWLAFTKWSILTPLSIVAIPLIEVVSLIIIRLSLSLSPFQGSPHHFALFLQKKGWSKVKILCWTFMQGLLFGGVGIGLMMGWLSPFVFFILQGALLVFWYDRVF